MIGDCEILQSNFNTAIDKLLVEIHNSTETSREHLRLISDGVHSLNSCFLRWQDTDAEVASLAASFGSNDEGEAAEVEAFSNAMEEFQSLSTNTRDSLTNRLRDVQSLEDQVMHALQQVNEAVQTLGTVASAVAAPVSESVPDNNMIIAQFREMLSAAKVIRRKFGSDKTNENPAWFMRPVLSKDGSGSNRLVHDVESDDYKFALSLQQSGVMRRETRSSTSSSSAVKYCTTHGEDDGEVVHCAAKNVGNDSESDDLLSRYHQDTKGRRKSAGSGGAVDPSANEGTRRSTRGKEAITDHFNHGETDQFAQAARASSLSRAAARLGANKGKAVAASAASGNKGKKGGKAGLGGQRSTLDGFIVGNDVVEYMDGPAVRSTAESIIDDDSDVETDSRSVGIGGRNGNDEDREDADQVEMAIQLSLKESSGNGNRGSPQNTTSSSHPSRKMRSVDKMLQTRADEDAEFDESPPQIAYSANHYEAAIYMPAGGSSRAKPSRPASSSSAIAAAARRKSPTVGSKVEVMDLCDDGDECVDPSWRNVPDEVAAEQISPSLLVRFGAHHNRPGGVGFAATGSGDVLIDGSVGDEDSGEDDRVTVDNGSDIVHDCYNNHATAAETTDARSGGRHSIHSSPVSTVTQPVLVTAANASGEKSAGVQCSKKLAPTVSYKAKQNGARRTGGISDSDDGPAEEEGTTSLAAGTDRKRKTRCDAAGGSQHNQHPRRKVAAESSARGDIIGSEESTPHRSNGHARNAAAARGLGRNNFGVEGDRQSTQEQYAEDDLSPSDSSSSSSPPPLSSRPSAAPTSVMRDADCVYFKEDSSPPSAQQQQHNIVPVRVATARSSQLPVSSAGRPGYHPEVCDLSV